MLRQLEVPNIFDYIHVLYNTKRLKRGIKCKNVLNEAEKQEETKVDIQHTSMLDLNNQTLTVSKLKVIQFNL
jgi:hypothetical protein